MLTTVEWEEFREDLQFCESLKQVVKVLRGSVKQHVLAENAGVSIETIRRVEQGRAKEISQNHLTLVAKALGLTARQLVIRAQAIPVQPHAMPIQTRGLGQSPPIGREEDKQRIIMDLAEARGVLLFGAPGQGKTTLARYVAAEIGSNFRHGVCEVDLESERQIENLPRLIAVALGQPDLPSGYQLLQGRSLLLILDSVDQMLRDSPIERFRDALIAITRSMAEDARIIITCQTKLEKQELITREVQPLRDDAAVELFHQMSDSEYRQDSAIEVGEFARDVLGGHPLSIKMVARYGRSVPLPLEDLRRLWEEKWGAIAAGEPTALDDRGLRASFELTFESLPETARLLFLALGLLPDGLPSVLVKQVWAETETDIYDALRILRDRSLLEEMQSFSTKVNRLRGPLFRFASAKLGEFEQSESQINESVFNARTKIDQWFDHYIAANAPQFADNDPSTKNQLIREQFHNIHASLDRRLAPSTDPATLAAAQGVLSLYWAYHNNLSGARNPISSTEDAISYLEKAQSIFVGNGLSSDAIRCTYYIGNIHWLRGEIPKAHSYLQEAQGSADVSEEISFEIQRAFAHIEYKEGDIRVAVDKYKAVAKLADGISLGCVFRCWVGLLDAYRKLDQLDSAFDLVTLIEPRMAECPAEVVGNLKRGHAYLLASAGRFDEAAEVYKLAITSFSHNAFGQAHCWRGQGDIHVRKQEYDQAANAFAAALRLYDEARKNPSLGVALVILGQGRLDLSQGNVSSALHRFGAAAQMLDREHLNEPYEFAVAHELIGDAYAASGDKERASAEFGISISYFSKVGAIAVADRIRSKIA